MQRIFLFFLLFAATTAVFAQKTNNQQVVTGTVLLSNRSNPLQSALVSTLKADWKLRLDSVTLRDKNLVFSLPGATVTLAFLDYPFNPSELNSAARLSWLWPNAAAEASKHQSQVVISVFGAPTRALELHQALTKVAACVLENSPAIGVYMNNQFLLLPAALYKSSAHNMVDNNVLPLYCWLYFGMVQEGTISGGYTLGLTEFGASGELEIVNSANSLQDTHALLYEVATHLIQYRQKPAAGQNISTQEGNTVGFEWSKAAYQGGDTWKVVLKQP